MLDPKLDEKRHILVIEDRESRINKWKELCKDEGWEITPILGDSVKKGLSQLQDLLEKTEHNYSATIADVMFGTHRRYGGLQVIETAIDLYGIIRFGELVIASDIEPADERVTSFVAKFRAIRGSSAIGNAASIIRELKIRFSQQQS